MVITIEVLLANQGSLWVSVITSCPPTRSMVWMVPSMNVFSPKRSISQKPRPSASILATSFMIFWGSFPESIYTVLRHISFSYRVVSATPASHAVPMPTWQILMSGSSGRTRCPVHIRLIRIPAYPSQKPLNQP
jgi:hypothetical protein